MNHREIGNLKLAHGNLVEALLHYNRGLDFAFRKNDMKEASLCYANRSAAYLEMRDFPKCLENIKLALALDCPSDLAEKLEKRRDKCRELGKDFKKCGDYNLWKFFKLSYPANDKIPFIVNCLEMRETQKYGRGIFTTQQLFPGDIIAIEEPFYKTTYNDDIYCAARCYECLKTNKQNFITHGYCKFRKI
jgi:hypothetical protein